MEIITTLEAAAAKILSKIKIEIHGAVSVEVRALLVAVATTTVATAVLAVAVAAAVLREALRRVLVQLDLWGLASPAVIGMDVGCCMMKKCILTINLSTTPRNHRHGCKTSRTTCPAVLASSTSLWLGLRRRLTRSRLNELLVSMAVVSTVRRLLKLLVSFGHLWALLSKRMPIKLRLTAMSSGTMALKHGE